MFSKYKNICRKLKINYKSDIAMCIGISLLLILISIVIMIMFSISFGLIFILIDLLYLYFHFSTLESNYYDLLNSKRISFYSFYHLCVCFMKNNMSIKESIKESLAIIQEDIKDEVNELLLDIESDNSINSYLKFSDNFDNDLITHMSLSLYQYSLISNYQLISIHEQVLNVDLNELTNEYINTQIEQLNKFKLIPVIYSLLVVISITAYLLSTIGEIVNV